jgi:lamin tail-like protein
VRRSLLSRPLWLAIAFGLSAFAFAATPAASPQSASAAACVRFSASNFNALGNDNLASLLNGEWVRIKNFCTTAKSLSGWTIKDYRSLHTYRFPTGVSIRPGYSITLYSGRGTNTSTKRYWQRAYGAVWNNTPPEFAYLRNAAGLLQSRWTQY